MIEFLSGESWITPQIDLLLYLQNIRVAHSELLSRLFLSLTTLGELLVPTIICSVVYWCINSKNGVYLFSLHSLNIFVAQCIKLLACVYRPWILSDKIHPVKEALMLAYGYSFPSGHTAQAASVYGGLAMKYGKNLYIIFLFVLMILLVGFSRLWLGVHTPQDVVTGLVIGIILVFLMNKIIDWAENNKNIYLYLIVAFDVIALALLIYIYYFNHYPYDYVNGILIVDPRIPLRSSLIGYGLSLGTINGAFLCRRFISFEASSGLLISKLFRALIGSFLIIIYYLYVVRHVFMNNYGCPVKFLVTFILGIFITLVYPAVIHYINKKFAAKL